MDADWAEQTAAATGIPVRALVAYAGAAIFKADQMPECRISWSTLAGVGAIESDHGRHDGSSLDAGGNAVPPIFGIALDGGNTAEITDTDDGEIDGDTDFDRAVGPMQLIPQTWRNWHIDGGGDGVEDPQNIDDAAVAAANYLCRSSIDDGHRGRLARRDLGLQLERHVPVERGRRSRQLHGAPPCRESTHFCTSGAARHARSPCFRVFAGAVTLYPCRASSVGDYTGRMRVWRVTQAAKGI